MDFNAELQKRRASYRQDGEEHIIEGDYDGHLINARGKTQIDALNNYDEMRAMTKHDVRDIKTILAGRGDIVNNRVRQ